MEQLSNLALTALAAGVGPSDTSIGVTSAGGVPALPNFRVLVQSADGGTKEVMRVTGVSGTTLNVSRASEPVNGVQAAQTFQPNALVAVVLTAQGLLDLIADFTGNTASLLRYWTGASDAATALQTLINSVRWCVIPEGTWTVGTACTLRDNLRIVLHPNATIQAGAGLTNSRVFFLNPASNVEIQGGTLDGRKDLYPAAANFGVQLKGACARVRIRGVRGVNFPDNNAGGVTNGDAVYLGADTPHNVPSDVLIEGCTLDGNLRQGVSITGGFNVKILGCTITNNQCSGVDVEPNSALDRCDKVIVKGNHFEGNGWSTLHGAAYGVTVGGQSSAFDVLIEGNVVVGATETYEAQYQPTDQFVSQTNACVNVGSVSGGGDKVQVVDNDLIGGYYAVKTQKPETLVALNRIRGGRRGILLNDGSDRSVVECNTLRDCWDQGIRLRTHYSRVAGNRLYNCSTSQGSYVGPPAGVAGQGTVINSSNGFLGCELSGNLIYDDRAAPVGPVKAIQLPTDTVAGPTWKVWGNFPVPTQAGVLTSAYGVSGVGSAVGLYYPGAHLLGAGHGDVIQAAAYGTTVTPDCALGCTATITVTDAVNFTVVAPLNPQKGTTLELHVVNSSGGAMGAVTWNAVYKRDTAFASPATGKRRVIRFRYDGSSWWQLSCSGDL